MQISTAFKTIFSAGVALFIFSCSNSKKDKVKVQEITLQDITHEEKKPEQPPPPPSPPKSPMPKIPVKEKCFVNDGLKYKTIISLYVGDTSFVLGHVTSEELGSGEEKTTDFIGTLIDNKLPVNFRKEPPLMGDASEWTNKTWSLKKEGAKETLHIVFNAKNYDTNKWEDTDYRFVSVDCK
jgi:hypothetical protein